MSSSLSFSCIELSLAFILACCSQSLGQLLQSFRQLAHCQWVYAVSYRESVRQLILSGPLWRGVQDFKKEKKGLVGRKAVLHQGSSLIHLSLPQPSVAAPSVAYTHLFRTPWQKGRTERKSFWFVYGVCPSTRNIPNSKQKYQNHRSLYDQQRLYLRTWILHSYYHLPQQASLLQCSSILLQAASTVFPALSHCDLTRWHPVSFPIPTHPPKHNILHVSSLSLVWWPVNRQHMLWQIQSQTHDNLLVLKCTSEWFSLAAKEAREEIVYHLNDLEPVSTSIWSCW